MTANSTGTSLTTSSMTTNSIYTTKLDKPRRVKDLTKKQFIRWAQLSEISSMSAAWFLQTLEENYGWVTYSESSESTTTNYIVYPTGPAGTSAGAPMNNNCTSSNNDPVQLYYDGSQTCPSTQNQISLP